MGLNECMNDGGVTLINRFVTQPPERRVGVLETCTNRNLQVIRKFFFKHNKSFRWHLGDYEKHNFSHLKACERRNFDFCVFLRMCSMPVGRVGPGVTTSAPSIKFI